MDIVGCWYPLTVSFESSETSLRPSHACVGFFINMEYICSLSISIRSFMDRIWTTQLFHIRSYMYGQLETCREHLWYWCHAGVLLYLWQAILAQAFRLASKMQKIETFWKWAALSLEMNSKRYLTAFLYCVVSETTRGYRYSYMCTLCCFSWRISWPIGNSFRAKGTFS